jgi:hypothetical protein
MADSKVTDFSAATSVNSADVLYLIQNNSDKKITLTTLLANLPPTLAKFSGLIALQFNSAQTIVNSGTVTATQTLTLISNTTQSSLTINDGQYEGQLKIIMCTSATATSSITSNIKTNVSFKQAGDTAILAWYNNDWWVLSSSSESVAQVNADWNANSGLAQILNKPTIPEDISDLTDTTNLLDITSVDYLGITDRISTLGSVVTFAKLANTSTSDNIDTDLVITRPVGYGAGIYNSALEADWNAEVSPAGTEWNWDGWDNLDDVKLRKYGTFRTTLQNRIGENIIGAELVMHDITNDKYYKIKFSVWQQGADHTGAFTYTRELINVTDNIGITFPDGSIQVTASQPTVDLPQVNIHDVSHTLRLIDRGSHIYGFNTNVKIPTHNEVPFPLGSQITVISSTDSIFFQPTTAGEGVVEIYAIGTGFGYNSQYWAIGERSVVTLTKVEENVWYITGSGIFED